jgi:hypothetical protein
MRRRLSLIVRHVILPLLAGGFIYAGWRDPTLPMFRWFEFMGLGPLIRQLRLTTVPLLVKLPYWCPFSLPDAIWVYALTAFMAIIWTETNSRVKVFWLSLGLLLGAGSELGQLVAIVPGTFDIADLSLSLAAAGLALTLTRGTRVFKRSMNDVTT